MLDLDQTRRFLRALSLAPDDNAFTFQTFDDSPDKSKRHLSRIYHGRLDEVKEDLIYANENGAGVYVAVNQTDLHGRSAQNVTGVRAIFVDSDSGIISLDTLAVKPNILIDSKRGQHAYWLLNSGEPLGRFGSTQSAIAEKLGTDASVTDLPRVMRLPGFEHRKSDPFLVKIAMCDEQQRHTIKEIVKEFHLRIIDRTTNEGAPSKPFDQYENKLKRCEAYLLGVPEFAGMAEGGRNKACFRIAEICFDFAMSEDKTLSYLEEWNGKNSPPLSERELYRVLKSAIRHRKRPIGCKLDALSGGSAADEIPPERNWEEDDPGEDAAFSMSENLPIKASDEDFPEPKPGTIIKSWAKKRIVSSVTPDIVPENTARDWNRIGADAVDTDRDLDHDDNERDGRLIANMLQREYIIRRDDSKCVYVYSGKFWEETSVEYIHKLATQYDTFNHMEMKIIREAANLALTKRHIRRINWNRLGMTEVAFNNGLFNFITGKMREHNHEDYLDRIIPYDWNPESECPTWLKCMEDWFPGGDEEKVALQEFFGYLLCSHAKYKKCLILFGGYDTGKSQVCSVAHELAGGTQFVCGISPDEMDDPKKLAPIKGKALNLVPDLKKNTVLADGGFKRLVSTGDPIQIDQKYTRSENYIPTAKHIFATNNLPVVTDSSGAVFKRLMILHFRNRIKEEDQDPDLIEKLKAEMQGIIAWAMEGAISLYNTRGKWTNPSASVRLMEEYKLYQNPLFFFIKESGLVEIDEEAKVETEKLRHFVNDFNGGKPYGRRGFVQLLDGVHEMFPGVKKSKYNGRSFVKGLRLADDAQLPLRIVQD